MSRQRFSRSFIWACIVSCSLALVGGALTYAANDAGGYKVVRRIPVGGDGGWDYLRVDGGRIFLSRGDHMMVVDEGTGKLISDLKDTKGIHGMALADDLGKGFTSNGGANSVTVFDLKTLAPTGVIKIEGGNPDSIIYDPMTKRVFTFNGKTNDATVIDATSNKVVGTIKLAGKPEEPALDGQGNMFVNIETTSTLTKIDTKTLAVKGNYPLAPCEGPSALAVDLKNHRLFSACDKVMVVTNADTGKVVASPPIGGDPDGNAYDPNTGMLFAACREGLVSVIHQDSADKYSVLGNITTQFGTRTMAMDSKTGHVFTVTADFKAAGAPTPENPKPRPTPINGSFVVLEIGK